MGSLTSSVSAAIITSLLHAARPNILWRLRNNKGPFGYNLQWCFSDLEVLTVNWGAGEGAQNHKNVLYLFIFLPKCFLKATKLKIITSMYKNLYKVTKTRRCHAVRSLLGVSHFTRSVSRVRLVSFWGVISCQGLPNLHKGRRSAIITETFKKGQDDKCPRETCDSEKWVTCSM